MVASVRTVLVATVRRVVVAIGPWWPPFRAVVATVRRTVRRGVGAIGPWWPPSRAVVATVRRAVVAIGPWWAASGPVWSPPPGGWGGEKWRGGQGTRSAVVTTYAPGG